MINRMLSQYYSQKYIVHQELSQTPLQILLSETQVHFLGNQFIQGFNKTAIQFSLF
jgi:hypothetical protein